MLWLLESLPGFVQFHHFIFFPFAFAESLDAHDADPFASLVLDEADPVVFRMLDFVAGLKLCFFHINILAPEIILTIMLTGIRVFVLMALLAAPQANKRTHLQPDFNIFTIAQDVELGKKAAAEIESGSAILKNDAVSA